MLHAFNRKNVRRVLLSAKSDHKIGKDEDGVTSMVFSPLAFMGVDAAATIALEIIGAPLSRAFNGRRPMSHDIKLWPEGLRDRSWGSGKKATRCEPDFYIRFDFAVDDPVILVGEVKWDWKVSNEHIQTEIDRQRRAMAKEFPNAALVMLAITKHRLRTKPSNIVERSWVQVHGAARLLAKRNPVSAEGRWGELIGEFLELAKQMEFQGFNLEAYVPPAKQTFFWNEPK
ncbi:hypothetical protein [Qipengyuania spongiae]|uniref:TnsA endonuclease N-terminal domain-containing protein n=1 Tax=Qipengyuania spongiae TaxID=2909673 RepID=A0ABY5SW71_9SPHN|nr:hypothetical protein [Qipengyuania spongiae]UVI38805.1 hypothetical protein L1F33_11195 [Qipengyuania spongiae]